MSSKHQPHLGHVAALKLLVVGDLTPLIALVGVLRAIDVARVLHLRLGAGGREWGSVGDPAISQGPALFSDLDREELFVILLVVDLLQNFVNLYLVAGFLEGQYLREAQLEKDPGSHLLRKACTLPLPLLNFDVLLEHTNECAALPPLEPRPHIGPFHMRPICHLLQLVDEQELPPRHHYLGSSLVFDILPHGFDYFLLQTIEIYLKSDLVQPYLLESGDFLEVSNHLTQQAGP